jgi:hypothetical protein
MGQLRLVAAHAWDIVGPDFRQVAQQIVAAESA